MLGITIGVAAVIVLVAVGHGSAVERADSRSRASARTRSRSSRAAASASGARRRAAARHHEQVLDLTTKDVKALQDKQLAPDIWIGLARSPTRSVTATYNGATLPAASVRRHDAVVSSAPDDYEVGDGRALHQRRTRASHAARRRARPDGRREPVRRPGPARPDDQAERRSTSSVVGVLKRKGTNGFQDQDDVAIAPLTTTSRTRSRAATAVSARSSSRRASSKVVDAAADRDLRRSLEHATSRLDGGRSTSASSTRRRCCDDERDQPHLHGAARRGRRDLAARRRDRRHEHHARHRHRADARDRHPQGDRRATLDILGQFIAEAVLLSMLGGLRRRRRRTSSAAASRSSASSPSSRPTRSRSRSASPSPSGSSSASTPPTGPPRCGRSKHSATNDDIGGESTVSTSDTPYDPNLPAGWPRRSRRTTTGTTRRSRRGRGCRAPTKLLIVLVVAAAAFAGGVFAQRHWGASSSEGSSALPACGRGGPVGDRGRRSGRHVRRRDGGTGSRRRCRGRLRRRHDRSGRLSEGHHALRHGHERQHGQGDRAEGHPGDEVRRPPV